MYDCIIGHKTAHIFVVIAFVYSADVTIVDDCDDDEDKYNNN